jgi:hypothetical protein
MRCMREVGTFPCPAIRSRRYLSCSTVTGFDCTSIRINRFFASFGAFQTRSTCSVMCSRPGDWMLNQNGVGSAAYKSLPSSIVSSNGYFRATG